MILNVQDETARLKAVAIGQPGSNGKIPTLDETYDAKSYEAVQKGVYPREEAIVKEMKAFEDVLLKYDVQVFKPWQIDDCNQVFARDVAFVLGDKIINSNIIPDRDNEKEAYEVVYNNVGYNKIYNLPEKAHVEGGDIVLYNETVFVGIYTGDDYKNYCTARTNSYALSFLRELFPEKNFIPLELVKNDTDPYKGILHLDCTFMPVSHDKAIIYREGFIHQSEYDFLIDFFGKKNVFEITNEEMYHMNTNVFSLSPRVVVSEEKFTRLNNHMREEWGMTVEEVPYAEISKMGGLLRCSTLPLMREYE